MKENQYGPCGLYCGACGAMDCGGCRSDRIDEYVSQCKFRICTRGKNIEFCCFCTDYPCEELHAFMHDRWPHHWTMVPNLNYIKKNGKQEWLQVQKQEWACRVCSAATVWYQKTCACGQSQDAWEVPTQ